MDDLDDTQLKTELDTIMKRIDGIMKKVEGLTENSEAEPLEKGEAPADAPSTNTTHIEYN